MIIDVSFSRRYQHQLSTLKQIQSSLWEAKMRPKDYRPFFDIWIREAWTLKSDYLWCFLQSLFFPWGEGSISLDEWRVLGQLWSEFVGYPGYQAEDYSAFLGCFELKRFRTRMQVRLHLSGSATSIVDVLSNMNMMCTNLQSSIQTVKYKVVLFS